MISLAHELFMSEHYTLTLSFYSLGTCQYLATIFLWSCVCCYSWFQGVDLVVMLSLRAAHEFDSGERGM